MKEFLKYLKKVWQYVHHLKVYLIRYIGCNFISICISVCVPILSAKAIIHLTSNALYQLILIAFVVYLLENLRNFCTYFSMYYSQIIYRESFITLQTVLGREMMKIENECMDQTSSGVFIQRLSNDTSKLADIFNVLNMYLSNLITDIGVFIAVFIISKIAFLYFVIMIVVLYFISYIRVKKRNEKDKIFRKKNERASGFVGEIVRGLRDIKMLNAEKDFSLELHRKVKEVNEARYAMAKVDRKYQLLHNTVQDLFDFGLIFLLVVLLKENYLEVASALIIHNYSNSIMGIDYFISNLLEQIKDFNLSSSRIFAIIDSDEFPKEKFGKKHLEKVEGNFSFQNVSFHYKNDKKKVLDHLSFEVKANETVAFVGKSGAGKTTIFHLLCRMYDVTSGKIMIDGVDIKKLDKDTIRGNITIISQNPYIFNISIRDNLRLMKEDLTDDEMIEACRLACLHDFIMQLPDGYDTIIGEGGVNLSGGQKQRLAIARAFIQKTEIILFDEATSALDNETQKSIQEAIYNMKKEYTILIIAHRLSTVINSDRILFLKDGRIEKEGTHQELLKSCPDYKKLYESELKSEEE